MNICIESQLLNHPRRSGLMTYTEGLVNSLRHHDNENDYTMLYYSLKRRNSEMPGVQNSNFKKTVLKVPDREFWGRQNLIDNIFLPHFLKENKVKIFHRPSGYTMPASRSVFKILTVHDLRTLTIGDKVWGQHIENYAKSIAKVDVCVVVSQCTKKDLVQYFHIDEKKIRVIYLGADERFKRAVPQQIQKVREKYSLSEPFLLSIGSVPRKNIDGIIRGFAASDDKDKFLLVLSCNLNVEQYRRLTRDLGIEQRVLILDKLSDEEVVALYSGCHAFVFPSLYEGFGLPIVEAMQCGAPVITSNISSCPEVAGNAAVLVNPLEVKEISGAINQVCRNENLRKDLIEKGYQRAKMFSWDNFGREMIKIYAMA